VKNPTMIVAAQVPPKLIEDMDAMRISGESRSRFIEQAITRELVWRKRISPRRTTDTEGVVNA